MPSNICMNGNVFQKNSPITSNNYENILDDVRISFSHENLCTSKQVLTYKGVQLSFYTSYKYYLSMVIYLTCT